MTPIWLPSPANGGTKKYYAITEKGRQTLEELTSFWEEYARCVDGFIAQWKENSLMKEQYIRQVRRFLSLPGNKSGRCSGIWRKSSLLPKSMESPRAR